MKRFLNTTVGARVKGLGVLALGSSAFLFPCYPVAAATEAMVSPEALKVHYDIPPQPLSTALKALADAADIQLVYAADVVGDIQAEALKGDYTAQEALGLLLRNTELTYVNNGKDTIVIKRSAAGPNAANSNFAGVRLAQNESAGSSSAGGSGEGAVQASATGGERLEEIIVSAQRREENLQDVPISINVLSGEELDESSYADVNDALRSVPGIDASAKDLFTGGVQISIRGVTNPTARAAGSGPVAYYIDSVPFGFVRHSVYPDAGSYDLSRVEVLSGPQGTLYGAGSLNGVVRVLTQDANPEKFEFKARASTSTTEGGGQNYRGSVVANVPLIEGRLAARAVVDYQDDAGWVDSPVARRVNDSERHDYRLKVRALPTDSLTVDLQAWRMETDNGAPSQSNEAQRITVTNKQPQSSQFDTYGLRLEQEFSNFTVTSMSSWIDYSTRGIVDGGPAPSNTPALLDVQLYSKVFSQEFNIVSSGDGPWRWSTGAFYRDAKDRTYQFLSFYAFVFNLAQNDYTDTSESYAVYGEIARALNDQWELSAGLRYFNDDQTTRLNQQYSFETDVPSDNVPDVILPIGSTYDSTSEAVTPRVVLTWRPTEDQTVYASYSQGFRSGFAQQPNVQGLYANYTPAEPDKLTNYEVGAKGDWLEGRVSYETALFYIDWQDIQQAVTVSIPPLLTAATVNGESASGLGASLALTFRPIDDLSLSGNIAWNDLKFDSDVITLSNAGPVALYRAGERLTTSPEWSAGASAAYSWGLAGGFGARASVAAEYQSGQTSPASPAGNRAIGVALIHASARFSIDAPNKNWTASLFVDNLTDEYRSPYVLLGGAAPEWVPRVAPRTWGAQLEYRFK